MRTLLDLHVYSEPRWKGLLKANAYAKPNDRRKRAMRDCGCNQHGDDGNVLGVMQRSNMDIRQIDHREGAQRQGVFWVDNGGNEVSHEIR